MNRFPRGLLVFTFAVAACGQFTVAAVANEPDDYRPNDPWMGDEQLDMEKSAFGLNEQVLVIDGCRFMPSKGGNLTWQTQSTWSLENNGGDPSVVAQVDLPAGGQINRLSCTFQDNDPSAYVMWNFMRKECQWPDDDAIGGTSLKGAFGDFNDTQWHAVYEDWNEVITYFSSPNYYSYVLWLGLDDDNPNVKIWGCIILWQRTISPAPASASFGDVPVGAFGFQHIEALYASGITGGCGGGNFCPNDNLTRAQMAVFLAKALGLHWGN